jgi:hypothetical protein
MQLKNVISLILLSSFELQVDVLTVYVDSCLKILFTYYNFITSVMSVKIYMFYHAVEILFITNPSLIFIFH